MVYLIRCADGSLYTGITTDVERRFQEHCSNSRKSAKYLKGKGPLTLVWQRQIGDRSSALQAEYRIKQLTKADKERLVSGLLTINDILAVTDI